MKLLKPYYYDEFKCIGDKCINHCCKNWNINIDDTTYNYYQSLHTPFGDQLIENISFNEKLNFRSFKLNEENTCPFLNEERLCKIYIELGETKMCHTCKTYPRTTKIRADVIEQTLTLSCPEVARILIECSDKIDFCFSDDVMINIKEVPVDDMLYNLLLSARACSINIMQMRNYSLWERQLLLVIFTNKIQECIDKNNYDDANSIINKFSDVNYLALYVDEFDKLKVHDHSSFIFIDDFITNLMLPILDKNSYMKEIFERQISSVDQMTLHDFLIQYEKEFKNYMKEKTYMYENFYVHMIFLYYMDALNDKNILKQIILTNIGYLIIQTFQMIAWVDSNKQLTIENSQLIFGGFSVSFEHNNVVYNEFFKLFREQNLTSLAFQAFLLS